MTIYQIVMTVLTIVFGFLSLYIKQKTVLIENAKDYINSAEEMYADTVGAGGQKFSFVVQALYSMVPSPMRVIFTEQVIGELVQKTFDAMADFAQQQLDKVFGETNKEEPKG